MSSDTWNPVSIDFINGDILYLFFFDTATGFSASILYFITLQKYALFLKSPKEMEDFFDY